MATRAKKEKYWRETGLNYDTGKPALLNPHDGALEEMMADFASTGMGLSFPSGTGEEDEQRERARGE